jgi:tetratricopeptide (TPR) repeat protein
VVVDTGSTDGSIEVARRHGAVVSCDPWRGDFAAARNRSLDLASGDWILYIDADETAHARDPLAVRAQLEAANDHVCFRVLFVPRVNWTPYREFRVWRNRPDIRFVGTIHETMLPAITSVARREQLLIGDLDALTLEHFGYEGDQRRKHARNEPMLRKALEADPGRVYLYDHLARIYEDLEDDARARATWRAGMAVANARGSEHPDDKLLWLNLVVHSVVRSDPDGDVAELLADTYRRFGALPALEFAAAVHEFAGGDAATAAHRLEQLLELDPRAQTASGTSFDGRIFGEWAWHTLGLCRFALDDFAGAAEAFRLAEAANPASTAYRTRRELAESKVSTRGSARSTPSTRP